MSQDPYHISLAEFDIIPETIGAGAYSEICRAVHKRDNVRYAVKIVEKDRAQRNRTVKYFTNERRVMLKLDHPRIIKLHWTTKDMQNIYFIYQLATHGELWESLRGFAEYIPPKMVIKTWLSQLFDAVEYLHLTFSIAHRDIKPENILLDDKFNLKLCDFGTSKDFSPAALNAEEALEAQAILAATQRVDAQQRQMNAMGIRPSISGPDVLSIDENRRRSILYQAGRTHTFSGTPQYMAPEVINGIGTRGTASDLWSLGVIIYQLETGILLFDADTPYNIMQNIAAFKIDLNLLHDPAARDLVRQLLRKNPRQRIGVVIDDRKTSLDAEPSNIPPVMIDIEDDENDLFYVNEIDPLLQRPKPKPKAQTTVSSTKDGWESIRRHEYWKSTISQHDLLAQYSTQLQKDKQQQQQQQTTGTSSTEPTVSPAPNIVVDCPPFHWNQDIPAEYIPTCRLAHRVCKHFIAYHDEDGNPVDVSTREQHNLTKKQQEEKDLAALDTALEADFPKLPEAVLVPDEDEHPDIAEDDDESSSSSSPDDENKNINDEVDD